MRIDVGKYSKLSFVSITVTHPDEPELSFDGGGYRTARMVEGLGDEGLFTEANEFIQKLSPQSQNALYECYARVESLYSNYDLDTVTEAGVSVSGLALDDDLNNIVIELYNIIKFEDLLFYIKSNRKLKIPAELSDRYNTDDKITPAFIAKTYTLTDYIQLMAVVLAWRFMIPIWGPYLKIAAKAEDSVMKEYNSFKLLRGSALYKEPVFDRMELYIVANTKAEDLNMAPVMRFLSEEELPTFAIALTAIRKLSIAPLSCETERHHLMKILYGFSTNKIKTLGATLDAGLLDKKNTGMFEDDNSSVLCIFRMREQISTGDLMVFKVFIEQYLHMAQCIDPDIDPEIVEMCVQNAINLPSDWRAADIQKGLVAWVLSPVITGSIIPLLNKKNKTLPIAMGVTQAILWHWGFHDLAILTTGAVFNHDDSVFKTLTGKMKLSDATLARLDEIYQYKLPIEKHEMGGWSQNAGVRGVELFNHFFSAKEWKVQCPKPLAKLVDDSHIVGFIETPPELRESLAQLLIKLSTLQMDLD